MEPTQTNIQAALDGIMHTNVKGTKYWICSELSAVVGDNGLFAKKASEICEKKQNRSIMDPTTKERVIIRQHSLCLMPAVNE